MPLWIISCTFPAGDPGCSPAPLDSGARGGSRRRLRARGGSAPSASCCHRGTSPGTPPGSRERGKGMEQLGEPRQGQTPCCPQSLAGDGAGHEVTVPPGALGTRTRPLGTAIVVELSPCRARLPAGQQQGTLEGEESKRRRCWNIIREMGSHYQTERCLLLRKKKSNQCLSHSSREDTQQASSSSLFHICLRSSH